MDKGHPTPVFSDISAETLTYDTMNNWLVPLVSERRETYEKLVELYEGEPIGPHVAFEDVLNPYVIDLLNEGGHGARLTPIFAFIEELAQHDDERVTDVIEVSTVEGILCGGLTEEALERAIAHMGPTTRTIAREMASMSRDENAILQILDRQ